MATRARATKETEQVLLTILRRSGGGAGSAQLFLSLQGCRVIYRGGIERQHHTPLRSAPPVDIPDTRTPNPDRFWWLALV